MNAQERWWSLREWRLERKLHVTKTREALALLGAIFAAIVVSSVLILLTGVGIAEGLNALVQGAVGSQRATLETLVQATPLIFTGLAAAVAFRARLWNIGGEGQFFAGAMGTFWVAHTFGGLPAVLLIPASLLGAAALGAAWGGIAGFLRARYETNEILVTVMLNFISILILSYLLSDLWRDPDTYYYHSEHISDSAFLPRLVGNNRLHWGFVIALVVVVIVQLLLTKTPLGFEIRALGINRNAANYKGISIPVTTVTVMAISGALAGLAGFSEIAGIHHRLQLDISGGYGFTGIIIALLGRLHPFGVVVAAIGFGALVNGSTNMQIATGIPAALVQVIQGLALVFVLVTAVAVRYRIRRVAHSG